MVGLEIGAPFGTFREYERGASRNTQEFLSHSAAYGLILNILGIEMREAGTFAPTLTKADLPRFRIALASLSGLPRQQRLLTHVHTTLQSGHAEKSAAAHGHKYHIIPVRRSFLSKLSCLCLIDSPDMDLARLQQAVEDPGDKLDSGGARYGLPFLGDNSYFLERLEVLDPSSEEREVDWVVKAPFEVAQDLDPWSQLENESDFQKQTPFRLTAWAARKGTQETRVGEFVWQRGRGSHPPDDAWVEVGPL